MASVFSRQGRSIRHAPKPRLRTGAALLRRASPGCGLPPLQAPAPFLRSAAQASAIRPPKAPPEASPKASEKNASTISGLAAFPVPTSSPSSPASPGHRVTVSRLPDVTTSRHPDTPPSVIPAFSPLSPSIFPFLVRPASVSASVPFPYPHRSLTTPPSALPPPRRCATLPKCGIFPPLPLTPAAGTLKHTGTLRAGCKSPPAVNPLARGSPRARFQGKSADPVQVRGRR